MIIFLSSCAKPVENKIQTDEKSQEAECVKAVWLTYYELEKFTKDNNESRFTSEIEKSFRTLKNMGFNTVTVQVRAFADAFYVSKYFPSSRYCFSIQGADMPYDPLKIICDIARKSDLKIEAWVNPYRVSNENDINTLCDSNIAKKWRSRKKTKSNVYIFKKGIYFNPASDDVTRLIVNGVKEIAENYSVSAIHFDDYFYPTTEKSIDEREYKKYRENAGEKSLSDFRRECVSNMVKDVYKAVKSVNKNILFGISPASNIEEDYNTLYADVEKWISNEGYIDYICPQVYFGFKNIYQPFMFTVKKWMYITKCDMYVGLPLYKAGKKDKYAAKNDSEIKNEFINNNNIIARQINYLAKLENIKGFYVFSYSSLFDKRCKEEVENMLKAMNNHSDSSPSQKSAS